MYMPTLCAYFKAHTHVRGSARGNVKCVAEAEKTLTRISRIMFWYICRTKKYYAIIILSSPNEWKSIKILHRYICVMYYVSVIIIIIIMRSYCLR